MPYLDRQIPPEDHKPGCPKPKAYGTYRRVKDEKGRRTWALRVLECPSCGVLIKLPHKYVTKKQNNSIPALPKILSEKEPLESTRDVELMRIRTKEVQQVIGREEKKYRAKIRAFNTMYKNDEKYCPRLKGKINWDPKLVERFLDIRPSYDEMFGMLNWPPLHRYDNRRANKRRAWIPDPDKFGYIKYDHDCYNIKGYEAWGKHPGIIDLNKLSEFETLVITEAQGRMEYMDNIIKKHLQSNIQVYYPAQDEDKKESKNSLLTIGKHSVRKSIS